MDSGWIGRFVRRLAGPLSSAGRWPLRRFATRLHHPHLGSRAYYVIAKTDPGRGPMQPIDFMVPAGGLEPPTF